jgi:hypothetical protein
MNKVDGYDVNKIESIKSEFFMDQDNSVEVSINPDILLFLNMDAQKSGLDQVFLGLMSFHKIENLMHMTESVDMKGFTFSIIKLDADAKKICTILFPCHKKSIDTNAYHVYQDYLVPEIIQNVMIELVQVMEYIRSMFYLNALLILTSSNFNDNLLKKTLGACK